MYQAIDHILEDYDTGRIDRRRLLTGLTALVATAAWGGGAQGAAAPSTFRSEGLNHIALRVPDVAAARDFYVQHLGCSVLRDGRHNCFLACGSNNFIALFRGDSAGLDHFCFTVEGFDPAKAVETLRAAGFEPERHEDRVYFNDLNGIQLQLSSQWGDYPGGEPKPG